MSINNAVRLNTAYLIIALILITYILKLWHMRGLKKSWRYFLRFRTFFDAHNNRRKAVLRTSLLLHLKIASSRILFDLSFTALLWCNILCSQNMVWIESVCKLCDKVVYSNCAFLSYLCFWFVCNQFWYCGSVHFEDDHLCISVWICYCCLNVVSY